jgi:hypothetical protein
MLEATEGRLGAVEGEVQQPQVVGCRAQPECADTAECDVPVGVGLKQLVQLGGVLGVVEVVAGKRQQGQAEIPRRVPGHRGQIVGSQPLDLRLRLTRAASLGQRGGKAGPQ